MGPKGKNKSSKDDSESVFDFPPVSKKGNKAASTSTGKRMEDTDDNFTSQSSGKYTTDKFGNTVLKSKLSEDKALEEMRAAARARRAAKEVQASESAPVETTTSISNTDASNDKSSLDMSSKIDEIRRKMAAGEKVTHKEKKILSAHEKAVVEDEIRTAEVTSGLHSFSLSMQNSNNHDNETNAAFAGAQDIIAENVSISAPSRQLLVDTNIRLISGRRYGLLGPNGRGKTTILKYLAARQIPIPEAIDVLLVEQEAAACTDLSVVEQVLAADVKRSNLLKEEKELFMEFEQQGEIELEGLNIHSSSKGMEKAKSGAGSETVERVSWSEEEWMRRLERAREVGVELEASGADAAESKVRKILTGLGFTTSMQENTSSLLSGGWRMRVSLACALYMEPRLLLLDEPTNHLDLNAVLWLNDYLSTIWKNTLVVVSHDADFLDTVCTDIIHLDNYKLNYYHGSYTEFEEMYEKIEAKKENDYKIQQKTLAEFKGNGNNESKALKKTLQKLDIPSLLEKPYEYKVKFRINSPEEKGLAIDLLDISFRYNHTTSSSGGSNTLTTSTATTTPPSSKLLFNNLRFRVNTYSRIAIVGPNGAGKSTLLRLLTGDLTPTTGDVNRHNKLRLGIYNQHFHENLPIHLTPVEYLIEQYSITVLEARKYLGMFGLDGARHLIKINQLSGGQKARVVFASLSLLSPHILILDEPTNHLDIQSINALINSLKIYTGGIILISHDIRLISAIECELYICGDSNTGLRIENKGFEYYKKTLLKETKAQQELMQEKLIEKIKNKQILREKLLKSNQLKLNKK